MSPDVQSKQFSWSGKKTNNDTAQKTAFKHRASHIVEFLYSICVRLHPSYTRKAMSTNMSYFLKSAMTRTSDGKEKAKQNRSKTDRNQEESNDTVVTSIVSEPDSPVDKSRQTVNNFSEDANHMDGSMTGEQNEKIIDFDEY